MSKVEQMDAYFSGGAPAGVARRDGAEPIGSRFQRADLVPETTREQVVSAATWTLNRLKDRTSAKARSKR